MIKNVICFFLVFFINVASAQIGIGTPIPNKNASLHLAEENKTLILNKVTNLASIDSPEEGMLIYDVSKKCIRAFANNQWSECFGVKTQAAPPVVAVDGGGFVGEFVSGEPLVNASFRVTVSNNSFSSALISFGVNDLIISDSDIHVDAVKYLNSSNTLVDMPLEGVHFSSGANFQIVYQLSGIPTQPGEIIGNWTKLTLNYSDTVDVGFKLDCTSGSLVNITPALTEGLRNGISYNGSYKISFSGANGFEFPAETYTIDGLTLSRSVVSGLDSGELIYNISGIYTGEDKGAIVFNTLYGCEIYFGILSNCNEILRLDSNLINHDGVYKIDIDKNGLATPIDCYCDMTTDGGGWTLVLNYNHKGGTNPDLLVRTYDLPILSNFALGTDESGTEYWGHFSNSLASKISFQQMRFYGETNNHNRKIHFKILKEFLPLAFDYVTGVNVSGSFQGVNQNFISLPSHNAFLPLDSPIGDQWSGYGDGALTRYPFFKKSTYHWTIKGDNTSYITNNRWEVDDSLPNGVQGHSKDTHHQVWIR